MADVFGAFLRGTEGDEKISPGILSILYIARRRDGVGWSWDLSIGKLLGLPKIILTSIFVSPEKMDGFSESRMGAVITANGGRGHCHRKGKRAKPDRFWP
jgi:hypothetical protein